jgi:hypothetical protein
MPLSRLYEGSTKALVRPFQGSAKVLLSTLSQRRLFQGSTKALSRLNQGSVKALLRSPSPLSSAHAPPQAADMFAPVFVEIEHLENHTEDYKEDDPVG